MKVLITGATGLVGQALGLELSNLGHEIFLVSRRSNLQLSFPYQLIQGDLSKGVIPELREHEFDVVFHLMGENIAQRWTPKIKERIYQSRVLSTENLIESLSSIKNWLTASAIGIYGDRAGEVLNEESGLASDFLAKVCQDWEASADKVSQKFPHARVVKLRLGMILSNQGGALPKLLLPFKWGVGGVLGDGQAFMSWIHIEDVIQIMTFILNNKSLYGSINAVAPHPVTNEVFTQILSQKLGRRSFLKVPKWALQSLMGEMSSVLLFSQNVSCHKILKANFIFKYPTLSKALDHLVGI